MKGKKFIATVKVVKPIGNMLEVGGLYKLEDLKRQFPFLDFNNKEYFETQYSDKFKKGDKVRYVTRDKSDEYVYKRRISTKKVYYVKGVSHEVRNDFLYTKYLIASREDGEDFTVNEDNLESAESKWIVSFSQKKTADKPAIHELDYFAWKEKICGTWKEMFVFDTYQQADIVAKLFAENTIEEIVNLVNFGKNVTDGSFKLINDGKF